MTRSNLGWLWFLIVAVLASISCHHTNEVASLSTGIPGNCTVWGKIADEHGLAVPGAEISIAGPALSGKRTAVTDESGYYWLPQLPSGNAYSVRLNAAGYFTFVLSDLQLVAGSTVRLDLPADTHGDRFYWHRPIIDYHEVGSSSVLQYNELTKEYELHLH